MERQGRSLWLRALETGFRPPNTGSGEVRRVAEAFCPACEWPPPKPPEYGTRIYDDEIVDLPG